MTEEQKEKHKQYCRSEKYREWAREYTKRPEVREKARKYRQSQKWKEYYAKWQKTPGRMEYQRQYKKQKGFGYYLKSKYGLTIDKYTEIFLSQNGKCAICGIPIVTKECDIDHDHETGAVRGLLCGPCNTGIGMLRDNFVVAVRAAEYLAERHL